MQISLTSPVSALIYTESRDVCTELRGPVAKAIAGIMALRGHPDKCFMRASLDPDGLIRLHDIAPWQEW